MNRAPRVLIADDQRDVLEALRLLLKGEGFEFETASSPGGVLAALEARDFDVALIDLNYARDTTSGQEGLDLLARIQALDRDAAGDRDDGVGQRRPRRRGDAARRARLRPEAVGQRAAADDAAHADRAGPRAAARASASRRRTGCSAHEGAAAVIAESPAMRPVLELIARVGPSDANVLITGEQRHRQGAGRALAPRGLRPRVTGRS